MMVEQTQGPGQRVFPSDEYAHLYEHRSPSQQIRIWMSTYVGDMPASGRPYGLDVDLSFGDSADFHAGVSQHPERGQRDIYGVTITFGPVVFQAFGTTIPALLDEWLVLDRHPIVFPLWPYGGSFTWSPTAGLDDGGVEHFADAILEHLQRKAASTEAD